jgi:hypothetical protein
MSGSVCGRCVGSVVDGDRWRSASWAARVRRAPVDSRTPPPSASFSIAASSGATDSGVRHARTATFCDLIAGEVERGEGGLLVLQQGSCRFVVIVFRIESGK